MEGGSAHLDERSGLFQTVDLVTAEVASRRADQRARYGRLRASICSHSAWGDEAVGDTLAVLAPTAYHLGAVRQIVRAVTR